MKQGLTKQVNTMMMTMTMMMMTMAMMMMMMMMVAGRGENLTADFSAAGGRRC